LNSRRKTTLAHGRLLLQKIQGLRSVHSLHSVRRICLFSDSSLPRSACGLLLRLTCSFPGLLDSWSRAVDFSNSRRAQFRKTYPNATNGEISSILAKVWKEAPPEAKTEYIEREARLREQYKRDLAAWEEAKTGDIEGGAGEGDDDDEDQDDDVDNDDNQEEDDRKPSAIELLTMRHYQASTEIDESSKADRSEITAPAGPQPLARVSNYARLPTSQQQREEEEEEEENNQGLVPMISTDIGGFLAAAAALSASSEDGSPPIRQAVPPGAASALDMSASVIDVVAQLPNEHLKDTDLPETPSD
jgi:HMG (high mobility group) box